MRADSNGLQLSATDLSHFLSCRHLTALDMAVARGALVAPQQRDDPLLEILIQRGREHEQRYVAHLGSQGHAIVDLGEVKDRRLSISKTLDAMRTGVDVIAQAALTSGPWFGRPDILQKVDAPSGLGSWSYEVADAKLVRETRGGTILQLSLYSEMLADAQGSRPELFHVITPDPAEPRKSYRVDDYAAYFRLVRHRMLEVVSRDHGEVAREHYPEPVDFCEYCAWFARCNTRRHDDDHLSLVAGITRMQRRELVSNGVPTLTALAELPATLPFTPRRGSVESLARSRCQAAVQLESRGLDVPRYALRPIEAPLGLTRLPVPSPGDVFLDLEGDPFAEQGGREYLFGVVTIGEGNAPEYRAFWGSTSEEEKHAFERVIDLIDQRVREYPQSHVYHYAPYEPAAFKRLMGRYATREAELDAFLRAGRFVDLYAVVRQSMFVGVERYSIKNLEPLFGFARSVALADANRALRVMEAALERNAVHAVPLDILRLVEGYNRDDCVATWRLREWLEDVRARVEQAGTAVGRPAPPDSGAPGASVSEQAQRVEALRARLIHDVPADPRDRTDEQQARWLMAYLLDFHRREDKPGWWEYFRLRELPDEDLFDEPRAVTGLAHVGVVGQKVGKNGKPTRTLIHRYSYPPQEMEIRAGHALHTREASLGTVAAVDRSKRMIDVEQGPSRADARPTSAFEHTYVKPDVMEDSIFALDKQVADAGSILPSRQARHRAFRDLLLRRPPRLHGGTFSAANADVDVAVKTVLDLHDSVLAIQGPPGTGKTYTGAQIICALVAAGRRVGVTGNSHKVLRNLLDAVVRAASATGVDVRPAHKDNDRDQDVDERAHGAAIKEADDNERAREMLQSGEVNVLGGTSWLWARPEFEDSVDVLFVDEAGQMSLANTVAISRAARSLVLLGDPQQLEHPVTGTHPDGVGASALQHILGDHQTIPADRGIFLPVTRRLPSRICAFTSEQYYERKLMSLPQLDRQALSGTGRLDGNGLWVVEVPHTGNGNYSDEEVDVVAALVAELTAPGVSWTNQRGDAKQMTGDDIVIVAPFNAHVNRLAERLSGSGVLVGTVDKIQGRQAAVSIYSMATSRPEDAPRGMSFLYSPNRLNVATSRAQCAAFIVASPLLFEPECRTPRQMWLANGLCRFREVATRV